MNGITMVCSQSPINPALYEERKRFIRLLLPYVEKSDNWEEAVFAMVDSSWQDAV